ncbi:MAG TPA: excinuclease ATPase subunit, partial [Candidatus Binatia bacterium]|nr:excinuclease ATPase subunit [Candidatus Binatia bacterium]
CNWVFLSAMIALEKRAQQLGANAVVNIVSYYQKVIMSSPTEFECHAGAVIAGVALKGDFVKIADK